MGIPFFIFSKGLQVIHPKQKLNATKTQGVTESERHQANFIDERVDNKRPELKETGRFTLHLTF